MKTVDLLVIGGGVNGAGIARDAAGRGLRTLLVERGDIGGATSSASSKLVHGGLRYLGYYEFGLVRESLSERARLLRAAPHITWPLDFVLPWRPGLRPRWLIRAGLWLYDILGSAALRRSRSVDLTEPAWRSGLAPEFRRGFAYADGWVDDARLVVLTLRAAGAHGAVVLPRTEVVDARKSAHRWQVSLRDVESGQTEVVSARGVVNAAGPWAEALARTAFGSAFEGGLRLVQGSHIVVPKIHPGDHALILQNPDGRVVFVLPFEGAFSLIGTTDQPIEAMPDRPEATPDEIGYLCRTVSEYLAVPVTPDMVRWSFAGVRPLFDDGGTEAKAISRDYKLVLEGDPATGPALLSVFGGKITTYRRLAEKVVNRLLPWFPRAGGPWTDTVALPGGSMPGSDFGLYAASLAAQYPWLPEPHLRSLVRRHGSLLPALLGTAGAIEDMGRHFGAGLYERELAWFRENEWARSGEDVLWRRTKIGLHIDADAAQAVDDWMSKHRQPAA